MSPAFGGHVAAAGSAHCDLCREKSNDPERVVRLLYSTQHLSGYRRLGRKYAICEVDSFEPSTLLDEDVLTSASSAVAKLGRV